MLLYGPGITGSVSTTLTAVSISKQIFFGCKKREPLKVLASEKTVTRHSMERESDLATYFGLKLYFLTRSETLVTLLYKFGISISYKRVLELEDKLAKSVCKQSFHDHIVCPSHLKLGVYSLAALDNFDYDPSSTTSVGSLHGTGISIIQCPTKENPSISRSVTKGGEADVISLPDEYTVVSSLFMKATGTLVPEASGREETGKLHVVEAKKQEQQWLEQGRSILESGTCGPDQIISWASFHASREETEQNVPPVTSMLPLFNEKADSPAMVKHGMDIIRKTIHFLNPAQIP